MIFLHLFYHWQETVKHPQWRCELEHCYNGGQVHLEGWWVWSGVTDCGRVHLEGWRVRWDWRVLALQVHAVGSVRGAEESEREDEGRRRDDETSRDEPRVRLTERRRTDDWVNSDSTLCVSTDDWVNSDVRTDLTLTQLCEHWGLSQLWRKDWANSDVRTDLTLTQLCEHWWLS